MAQPVSYRMFPREAWAFADYSVRNGFNPVRVDFPEGGYDGHAGGDSGFVSALYEEMHSVSPEAMTSSISVSVESHYIGFAAEESRRTGRTIALEHT
jgi:hypothetical protein